MEKPIRIAIVGPESTGKSIMAEQLAAFYHASFVPEFAREYLQNLNRKYTYDDVLYIAEQQMLLEKKVEEQASGKCIFYDTTLLTIKIWFRVVFDSVPEDIDERIRENTYDLYLLMDIDMLWEPDPLREHPHFRKELLQMHIEELDRIGARYAVVKGVGAGRQQCAQQALQSLI
jgi:nicotinamide riboside kinase